VSAPVVHYQSLYLNAMLKARGTDQDAHEAGLAAVKVQTELTPELLDDLREFFPEGVDA
jgi:hypothetical protein